MPRIFDIAKKIGSSFSSNNNSEKVKMTPNEAELASYKKREYHDNVKKELQYYRSKNKFMTVEQDRKVLCSGNVFTQHKAKPLINGENVFRRKHYGKI